ncbi:unnamed protein product [Rotaria socialis]|uniref:Metalloendopeptidase n=2 Tax=Rotaria socialis TaxID=392032 RepID=A0A821NT61_9BILA|nr:unnamed protein product [Rotaria socialis]
MGGIETSVMSNTDPFATTWSGLTPQAVINSEAPSRDDPITVYYYFADNLPEEYRSIVYDTIDDIEDAAPGIQFKYNSTATNRIRICYGAECKSAVGMVGAQQNLQLANWAQKGDVLHEFMHALGFLHEYQREDRDLYVTCWSKDTANYVKKGMAIGRYDADSVMHYPDIRGDLNCHNLWAPRQCKRLSNGDKVGLNKLYPPVRQPRVYNPEKGYTDLYYCGRHNMENNNAPFGKISVDGYCGPNNGPNCPSCREYGGIQTWCNDEGSYATQGETGLFYCGRRFTARENERRYHDGFCGPNNGPHCDSCRRLLE